MPYNHYETVGPEKEACISALITYIVITVFYIVMVPLSRIKRGAASRERSKRGGHPR